MAYVRGNLALQEKKINRTPERYRETTKVVKRKVALPMQEKLLYLFTIVICVFVAGVIIWRYAQIYDLNTQMQQMNREIQTMQQEIAVLKIEKEKLESPERIREEAEKLGLIARAADGDEIDVHTTGSKGKNVKTSTAQ
ncbi:MULTISPECIES: cell division protein FtsL [unclassified Paenibacillus]|uniref:cell division protein FtsL n=1 Tax=unclassified Paenibacillus TaxID=185978 RepID=UPI001C11242A|nr:MULTISPECIES: cell division protein FtsL [unclassified Paenibacillus]MBU5440514.1 cell division protein FtsL [Paenibacillus sp. MSJ-34]CAH0119563.1 Cell division protein FtsL [Paenibacillus sp. CECT 9249]